MPRLPCLVLGEAVKSIHFVVVIRDERGETIISSTPSPIRVADSQMKKTLEQLTTNITGQLDRFAKQDL